MRLYTGRGDRGSTDLLGARVSKDDPRIEALGALDEASSALGLARAAGPTTTTRDLLIAVQRDLYKIMAELAFTTEHYPQRVEIGADRVAWLEAETDRAASAAPTPREFVLPGQTPQGATLDWARVMARQAERRLVAAAEDGAVRNQEMLRYLNRLSSLLFALSRREDYEAGAPTLLAKGVDGDDD
ncbi:MAG: cob(I)yrinic acid a,c-diamide adenosyltransferase [Thermomicrobiales bacterium]|nr:cob(I)yrinic acid a,c-diamide adenosyltransferase [Thermomicrobiales bacterium]